MKRSIVFNFLLFKRGIVKVKENDLLIDIVNRYDTRHDAVHTGLESMLEIMRGIDIRGSFESDDEVGAVFTTLKEVIEAHNNEL